MTTTVSFKPNLQKNEPIIVFNSFATSLALLSDPLSSVGLGIMRQWYSHIPMNRAASP